MSKHPLAATAEGLPAQTARDLLSDMEDDMHLVRDHALVLNNALSGSGDMPEKLRSALANTSCELLGIGEKLSAFHEAMHEALRRPEAMEASEPAETPSAPAARKEKPDIDGAFANLARIVSNLHWFMLDNMHRATNAKGEAVYEIRVSEADEFFSIIYIADHWSKRVAEEALS